MNTRTPSLFKLLLFLPVLLSVFGALNGTTALPQPKPAEVGGLLQGRQLLNSGHVYLQKRANSSADIGTTLPPHCWQLAKSHEDIDNFRQKYNLTLISSKAYDAALMPSWPQ